MKKLLIFDRQPSLSMDELEHHLFDTEATRDDYLDMSPKNVQDFRLQEGYVHYSEWDLAVKEGDEFEYWHMAWHGEHPFVFDDPYMEKLVKIEKHFRGPKALCMMAGHKNKRTVATYRMTKEMSERLTSALPDLLEHVDNETTTTAVLLQIALPRDFVLAEEDGGTEDKAGV